MTLRAASSASVSVSPSRAPLVVGFPPVLTAVDVITPPPSSGSTCSLYTNSLLAHSVASSSAASCAVGAATEFPDSLATRRFRLWVEPITRGRSSSLGSICLIASDSSSTPLTPDDARSPLRGLLPRGCVPS
eukprot:CAMPEP_0198692832 /NCGR_PEP_ID=MMETSP1468-20131203/236840_1 /TAXON_ID=1461545 /ORGANISM="Mantoniella sp, Strain CCMP1436" /LENGTH=131 /DNA_ID=CAMNT_0044447045 /DNA_START=33 /DNA_END=428 /DNA_ORIENTATION=+